MDRAATPINSLAIVLAFGFAYALTIRPLVASGMRLRWAGRLAVASDTLSIATMEAVDTVIVLAYSVKSLADRAGAGSRAGASDPLRPQASGGGGVAGAGRGEGRSLAARRSSVRAAASRIASLSVAANPATMSSAPSTVVVDCHHQERSGALGAARRPITIRVWDSSSMPMRTQDRPRRPSRQPSEGPLARHLPNRGSSRPRPCAAPKHQGMRSAGATVWRLV